MPHHTQWLGTHARCPHIGWKNAHRQCTTGSGDDPIQMYEHTFSSTSHGQTPGTSVLSCTRPFPCCFLWGWLKPSRAAAGAAVSTCFCTAPTSLKSSGLPPKHTTVNEGRSRTPHPHEMTLLQSGHTHSTRHCHATQLATPHSGPPVCSLWWQASKQHPNAPRVHPRSTPVCKQLNSVPVSANA